MKVRLKNGTGYRDYRYVTEETAASGEAYIYLRRKGQKKVRLTATPGTDEFEVEYKRAFAAAPEEPKAAKLPAAPHTLRWLVERYYESAIFKALGDSTRSVRRGILDSICLRAGKYRYAMMRPADVAKLRDEKAEFPEAANARVKALRALFKFAKSSEYGYATNNPAMEVGYLKPTNPDGFHSWTAVEIERYCKRHPIGTKARLALDLVRYIGIRRSDLVKLGPQMERGEDIHFTEHKGRRKLPKHRVLPILPELRVTLRATPSGHLTYLVTEFGKPFTANGFGNWFKRRCVEAGLPHCSAHGVRKAGATKAADEGGTEYELMAIYGWESPKQAAIYTKKANREKLARGAMHLLGSLDTESEKGNKQQAKTVSKRKAKSL